MMTCPSDRLLASAVLACLLAGPATAADDPAKQPMVGPSFWKASQLYELCTSPHQTDRAHCEGFITGVASTLQNDQISRVRVCIPKGTSSNDVVQKVVWYLSDMGPGLSLSHSEQQQTGRGTAGACAVSS